jgi:hypothetical protein
MPVNDWAILVQQPGYTLVKASEGFKVVYANTRTTLTLVLDEAGATTLSVTPRVAPVQELEWTVTETEGSLDARLSGGAHGVRLNVAAQDIVTIFTRGYRFGEDTTRHYPRWRGMATVAPSAHRDDGQPQGIELVGTRDSLYQAAGPTPNRPATGFLGRIVAEALLASSVSDSLGSRRIGNGAHVDTSRISTGRRVDTPINHNSKNAGEFLDAIRNVTGLSYVWGVNPYGRVYFQLPRPRTASIQEGVDGGEAEWREVQAFDIATRVRWFLGQGNSGVTSFRPHSVDLATPDNIVVDSIVDASDPIRAVREEAPSNDSSPLVEIPATPLLIGTPVASYIGSNKDSTFTLSRMTDGDPTSYIVMQTTAKASSGFLTFFAGVQLRFDLLDPNELVAVSYSIKSATEGELPKSAVAVQTVYEPNDGSSFMSRQGTVHLHGQAQFAGSGFLNNGVAYAQGLPELTGELVFGDRARKPRTKAEAWVGVWVLSETTDTYVAIADLRAYRIDRLSLDQAARQLVKASPERSASVVSVDGEAEPASEVYFDKLNGVTVPAMKVESTTYSITGAGGQRTRFNIGPRSEPTASAVGSRVVERDRRNLIRAHSLTFSGRSHS